MKTDTGGAAFPVPGTETEGMTLLDWLAGQAMTALLPDRNGFTPPKGMIIDEWLAFLAYNQAEAMIAEKRGRKA